ncbi:DUF6625 family protein [Salinibacter sp.]|uniref:DUF6625 family protein n=1 Tax=Salinibacter sp. TaxID=2065818 RepID=UPI00325FAB47
MTSICLVSCYFGSWPRYINLFLESCRYNPTVDFLLFSDCGPLPESPPNVRVVEMELDDIRQRARENVGIKEPAIHRPFKLCDFRPAFGVIFEDYLSDYEFWGHTDVDLVYGKIRDIVNEDILNRKEIISGKKYYLTGWFWLFENNDKINNLFRRSADYEAVMSSERNFIFDECAGAWDQLIGGASILDLNTEIESMTEVIRREEQAGRLRTHFANLGREIMNGDPYTWEEGALYEGENERLLFHFVLLKNRYYFTFPDWETVPSRFHILPTGFYRDGEQEGPSYLRALPAGKIARRWWQQTSENVKRRLPWR